MTISSRLFSAWAFLFGAAIQICRTAADASAIFGFALSWARLNKNKNPHRLMIGTDLIGIAIIRFLLPFLLLPAFLRQVGHRGMLSDFPIRRYGRYTAVPFRLPLLLPYWLLQGQL